MHKPNGIGSIFNMPVGNYRDPILRPEAAERVRQLGEISLKGIAFPNPSNHCMIESPPFVLHLQRRIQMMQRPNEVVITYEQTPQARIVRLNSQHPTHLIPSWSGDSVGHYEGDTLVVDTVGVKVGPLSMIDIFGTPHSEAMHLIERYRLIDYEAAKGATEKAIKEQGYAAASAINEGVMFDPKYMGKGLQVQFTVDDPNVFTAPWSAAVTYRRAADDWVEYVCPENTQEYYAQKNTEIPTADTPDF
ncbi:MAG TPA: hypothetical protein VFW28_16110 [Micropepsaceae bacterium]|nr:hypothetical protein [Micropepsaceae bacterium]